MGLGTGGWMNGVGIAKNRWKDKGCRMHGWMRCVGIARQIDKGCAGMDRQRVCGNCWMMCTQLARQTK